MDIQEALQSYLTVDKISNHSQATIENHEERLTRFVTWIKTEHGITDTDAIQVAHLRAWVAYLQDAPNLHDLQDGKPVRKLKDSTVFTYASTVAAFCRWLVGEDIMKPSVVQRFKLPKVEETIILPWSQEDVQKLLKACESPIKGRPQLQKAITARNRAIVSVVADTGIRRSELIGLRLCDIDQGLRVLLVHRKGNKWQQVPIAQEGFKALHDYLTKHRPYLAKRSGITKARKDDKVFLTERGTPLTVAGLSDFFWRLGARAGVDDKVVSAHQGRRFMATTQVENGRDSLDVMRQMGHSTLQMTNKYVRQSIGKLQESHEKHAPLRVRKPQETHGIGTGYWEE